MDYKKQIASVIRIYRIKAKLSQETLGFEIGLSQQQINDYEHCKSGVPIDKLMKLADVLKIPLKEFIKDDKGAKLLAEFQDSFIHYEEIMQAIKKNPKLINALKIYNSNSENLKDIDLAKLLTKLAKLPKERRRTMLEVISKF